MHFRRFGSASPTGLLLLVSFFCKSLTGLAGSAVFAEGFMSNVAENYILRH